MEVGRRQATCDGCRGGEGAIRKEGEKGRFHEFGVSMFAKFGFCPRRNPPPRHAVAMLPAACGRSVSARGCENVELRNSDSVQNRARITTL